MNHHQLPAIAEEQRDRSTHRACHFLSNQAAQGRGQVLVAQGVQAQAEDDIRIREPPHRARVRLDRGHPVRQELPQERGPGQLRRPQIARPQVGVHLFQHQLRPPIVKLRAGPCLNSLRLLCGQL